MTYEEAIEETVTRAEARAEIAQHCANLDGIVLPSELAEMWADFTAEHGDHDTYQGATVLGWLGY